MCGCDDCKTELLTFRVCFTFIAAAVFYAFVSFYIDRTEITVNDKGVTIIRRFKENKEYPFSEYGFNFYRISAHDFPLPKFLKQFAVTYKIGAIHRETLKRKTYYCFDFSEKTINALLLDIYQRNQFLLAGTSDEMYKLAQSLQEKSEG
jgi:hypothetical protein